MGRSYKINEQTLSDYMNANHMATQSIIGESADSFIMKKGSKMGPLSKAVVEEWAIREGKVEGLGMSQDNRDIFNASKRRNTTEINAKKAYDNTLKEDNLVAYRNQTKEHRTKVAAQDAYDATQSAGEAIEGVHYKSYKSSKR